MNRKNLRRVVQLAVAATILAASGGAHAQPSCNTGGWPTNDPCVCDVPWQSLSGGDTCATGRVCDRSSGWGTCLYYPSCNNGGWATNDPCLCDVPWQSQVPGSICQSGQVCDHGTGSCSGGGGGGGGGGTSSYPSCNTGGWPTSDPCICDIPWQSLSGGDVCAAQQVCSRSGSWGTCSGGTGGGGGGGGTSSYPSCNTGGWPTNDPCICDIPWQSLSGGDVCAAQQVCSRSGSWGTCSGGGAGGGTGGAGDDSPQPAFGGQVMNLDPSAAARAGFDWFEIGYPEGLSSAGYQTLVNAGVRVFAYVNSAEVPNDEFVRSRIDAVLGYSWTFLRQLGYNQEWDSAIIDVRQSEWQRWLLARAEQAWAAGARGIKWDVANYEDLYRQRGYGAAEAQQAIDAMYATMAELKRRHPDLKQVVNQGYALAEQHPDVVDGLEVEHMIIGAMWSSDPGMNQWFNECQARWTAVHDRYGMPVIMAEYTDPYSTTAATLESQIEAWGLTPYITSHRWDIQGRGLNIVPPW